MRCGSNSNGNNTNYFSIDDKDGIFGYKHSYFNNRTYYVFVMAFDKTRSENLSEFEKNLLWSIIFSIWLSVLSFLFILKEGYSTNFTNN